MNVTFELDRLPEYTDEAMLDELRRVAALVGKQKLNTADFSRHSKVGMTTLRRRFGSWPKALERAGLSHLYNPIPPATKSRTLARGLSTDQLISEMKRVASIVGRASVTAEDVRQHSVVGTDALRGRFGSFKAARDAAGMSDCLRARRYTDEECFENMLVVWTHYGRAPRHREMSLSPSAVGPKAYVLRWGSWNKALKAFVDRVNSDAPESAPENHVQAPTVPQSFTQRRTSVSERQERRDIPLGLRYRVLKTDFFKCVLCGASPATDPRIVLHVDHIHPFTLGGRTELGNLRTLCSSCNLGKGIQIEQGTHGHGHGVCP